MTKLQTVDIKLTSYIERDNLKKIKVAILGGTGAVGQKFVALLDNHPWFEISEITASSNSAGKTYESCTNWREITPIPERVRNIIIKNCDEKLNSQIVFSALDSSVAGDVEKLYAKNGHYIFSNSKNHRMSERSPILIPEINADHLQIIDPKNFIVTNANCTTTVLALAIYPIHQKYQITELIVTSMQAISGAGYPGPSANDIMNNVIPFIDGEEQKVETEIKKILGTVKNSTIVFDEICASAHCNRVPVFDGHTVTVSLKTKKKATIQEIENCYNDFSSITTNMGLPFAPKKLYNLFTANNRPQPKLDIFSDNAMAISIGRLRPCSILDYKLVALGHNTIRGAAGGSILNAEYCVKTKIISI